MADVDEEAVKTPRITGSYVVFLDAASNLHRVCEEAALVFAKRLDVLDIKASRRCETISAFAEALAEEFDAWTRNPPSQEERGRQIDSLMQLREEARALLAPLGFVV